MALRNLFFVMFTAIAITMVIALGVAPRLQERADAPAPVTVAVATPEPAPTAGSMAAFIDREDDCHFWARADVSGTQVKFMVDTGARIVALTYLDAQRLGLKPE